MKTLDHDRPYGTVYEMPGVRFQQDGVYYRQNGQPVEQAPPDLTREPDPPSLKPTSNGWGEDDLRRPENRALKAQLNVYNVEWTTRKAALEFLASGVSGKA